MDLIWEALHRFLVKAIDGLEPFVLVLLGILGAFGWFVIFALKILVTVINGIKEAIQELSNEIRSMGRKNDA